MLRVDGESSNLKTWSTTTCNGSVTNSAKEDIWSWYYDLILIDNRVGQFLVYVFLTLHLQELFKDTVKAYFY